VAFAWAIDDVMQMSPAPIRTGEPAAGGTTVAAATAGIELNSAAPARSADAAIASRYLRGPGPRLPVDAIT
jgi:hypothetical protein